MGLKTEKAVKTPMNAMFAFPGRFELDPLAKRKISTPTAGTVKLYVEHLQHVKKGDAVFSVTSNEIAAKKSEIKTIENRLLVYKKIKTANAALENELTIKKRELEAILSGLEEKDAVIVFRAHTDGIIEKIFVENGSWIEKGDDAVEITDLRKIRFTSLLCSSDARKLIGVKTAKIGNIEGSVRIGTGNNLGITPVYVVFSTQINALPGEKATAKTAIGASSTVQTSVPTASIVKGVSDIIFSRAKHDNELFFVHHVQVITRNPEISFVQGLPENIEVVTEGAYELKLALSENGEKKRAGHFHADGVFHEGEHH
jgi:biotin carboxyl carrier protein